MAGVVARRYAEALFQLCEENGELSEVRGQAADIRAAIEADAEFQSLLNHPRVAPKEKLAMLENVFKNEASGAILGLFSVVVAKRREAELAGILERFAEMVDERQGVVAAHLSSARALEKGQAERIAQILSEKLGKRVLVEASVDPRLIGGMVIRVDGYVMDSSVKHRMEELKTLARSVAAQ